MTEGDESLSFGLGVAPDSVLELEVDAPYGSDMMGTDVQLQEQEQVQVQLLGGTGDGAGNTTTASASGLRIKDDQELEECCYGLSSTGKFVVPSGAVKIAEDNTGHEGVIPFQGMTQKQLGAFLKLRSMFQAVDPKLSSENGERVAADVAQAFNIFAHPDSYAASLHEFVMSSNPQKDISVMTSLHLLQYASAATIADSEVDMGGEMNRIFDSEFRDEVMLIPAGIQGVLSYGVVARSMYGTHPNCPLGRAVEHDISCGRFIRNESSGEVLIIVKSDDGAMTHMTYDGFVSSTERLHMKTSFHSDKFDRGEFVQAVSRHTRGVQTRFCPTCKSSPSRKCGCAMTFVTPRNSSDLSSFRLNSLRTTGDFFGEIEHTVLCSRYNCFLSMRLMSRVAIDPTSPTGPNQFTLHYKVVQGLLKKISPSRLTVPSPGKSMSAAAVRAVLARAAGAPSAVTAERSEAGGVPACVANVDAGQLDLTRRSTSVSLAHGPDGAAGAFGVLGESRNAVQVDGEVDVASPDAVPVVMDISEQSSDNFCLGSVMPEAGGAGKSGVPLELLSSSDLLGETRLDVTNVPGGVADDGISSPLSACASEYNVDTLSSADGVAAMMDTSLFDGMELGFAAEDVERSRRAKVAEPCGSSNDGKSGLETKSRRGDVLFDTPMEARSLSTALPATLSASATSADKGGAVGSDAALAARRKRGPRKRVLTAEQEAARALRQELRKEKNRAAAAVSNARRKERNKSLRTNLANAREQLQVLQVRERMLKEENEGLRARCMPS